MNPEEDDGLNEILFSPETKNRFGHVIGFDLGSSALSCSFSADKTPRTATVFQDWANGSQKASLFPTCMQYKSWSTTNCNNIKTGFEGHPEENPLEKGDLYIPSVKDYVLQWIIDQDVRENEPDASLVLKDYLEAVRTQIENALKEYKGILDETRMQDGFQSEQIAERYSLDDCRFCFTVPNGLTCTTEYKKLVRDAFWQAGFLKENDDDNRLVFLNDAAAICHSCINANQVDNELETNYLIADIGYETTKITLIHCKKEPSASSVSQFIESNAMPGYGSFRGNFKNHITSRSSELDISPEEIGPLVAAFEKYQESKISLSDNTGKTEFIGRNKTIVIDNSYLQDYVFMPYLENIILDFITEECQAYKVAKLILRAQYCDSPYPYMACEEYMRDTFRKLSEKHHYMPECVVWVDSMHMASNGAALIAFEPPVLSLDHTQIPKANKISNTRETKRSEALSEGLFRSNKSKGLSALPKGCFVVGIDFGTTFSGCSYAYIGEMKDGEERTIETIDNWDKAFAYQKIPTALIYNEKSGKFSKLWGFDALKPQNTMRDGNRKLELFKLLLYPMDVDIFHGEGNIEIQEIMADLFIASEENNKKKTKALTPTDMVAEYLNNLNSKIKDYLGKSTGIKAKSMKFKYIITVPAVWTDIGRATMIKAAIKAGLIKSEEDKSIQLITESKAAAFACEKFMKETIKMNDEFYDEKLVFTVFDAGGGTVEVVTFKQTTTEKDGKKERKIEQIGDGTGDTCGAVYLSKIFREAIVNFYINTMGQRVKGEHFFNHHVNYFKEYIKDNFIPSSRSDAVYRIPLPPLPVIPLDIRAKPWRESTDPNRPRLKCRLVDKNTVLEIPVNEVQRCIFDPVVDKAVDVLDKHLKKTSSGNRPSAVLMVGGFSQSKYLQQKIQKFCVKENIQHISAPPEGVTAISRGAVKHFLEHYSQAADVDDSFTGKSNSLFSPLFGILQQDSTIFVPASTRYTQPSLTYAQSSTFDDEISVTTSYTDHSNVPRKAFQFEHDEHLEEPKDYWAFHYDIGIEFNSIKYLEQPIDYSMYHYNIGIDIGSNSISCSYTNLYDPTEVHSITKWSTHPEMEEEYSTDATLEQTSYFERYPTCILYKEDSQGGETILCGYDALHAPKTADDLFFPNIRILLNNTFARTQSFKMSNRGLTVHTVLKDFLKGFLKHLHPLLLDNICQDLRLQLTQDVKIASAAEDYVLKKNISEKIQQTQKVLDAPNGLLDNSQLNIVFSANGQIYNVVNELISEAFVESDVFGSKFDEKRIRFTQSAEAAAYTCLSRPGFMSNIKCQQCYLVCDIGYASVTISKIVTGSNVMLNSVEKIDISAGAEVINDHFKDYLYKNKTDLGITSENQIEDLVADFSVKNLGTIFDFSENEEEKFFVDISAPDALQIRIPNHTLCHVLVKEFLSDVIGKLNELYKEDPNIDKIFVFGRYHRTQLFWEQVTKVNKDPAFSDKVVSFNGDSSHDISSGAVQYGVNSEGRSRQFPENDTTNHQRTKLAEPPLEDFNNKDDFVLGIDLGNILSGCSYKSPFKQTVQVFKEWHHKLCSDKDGKVPTALVIKYKWPAPFKPKCWGNEARHRELKNDEHLVDGMKLRLCKADSTQFYNNDSFRDRKNSDFEALLEETSIINEDDVLRMLMFHLASLIKHFKRIHKPKKNQELRIVLTAPSMWSTFTRRKIIELAIEERIVEKKDRLKIRIISELEAATIAYEPYLSRLQKSGNLSTFIMADIGGKTADASTFQLSSKYDVNNKMVRTVLCFNDDKGDVCGATFLEERFIELVREIYRGNKIVANGLKPYLHYYANFFIAQLKENHFNHRNMTGYDRFEIPLPPSHCELSIDKGTYKSYIVSRKLRIPYRDIHSFVFEPLVKRITDLLMKQVKESVATVDAIVLVGGFLYSTYLQDRIRQNLPNSLKLIMENPENELYNRSTCVSYGAASYFMNSHLLSYTHASLSYAMSVGSKGDKTSKRLMCIMRKGDFVKGNIYHHSVHVTFPNDAVIEISASSEAGIAADSTMKPGELVSSADAKHFVEFKTYIFAMPEVLSQVFDEGETVALRVSFQIATQEYLDVQISLASDQKLQKKRNIPSCLKSFRI